ncbi:antitoxin family protein [Candidatus Entotheonella palauensis]|uniref:antitoxin family protein n=1 Tax=Candidatus Entotheonella palauensis TaxID=93172 RepID=UPI0015C4524A|nr:antitoxin family protein [Candidatus Entotheonella palauensis]
MAKKIEAIYEGGAFYPIDPVDLAEHQRVILIVNESAGSKHNGKQNGQSADAAPEPEKHVWEIADELLADIPEETLNALPSDGAAQLDHYLYGTPKRST